MLSQEEIDRLAAFDGQGQPGLSVCLDLDAGWLESEAPRGSPSMAHP